MSSISNFPGTPSASAGGHTAPIPEAAAADIPGLEALLSGSRDEAALLLAIARSLDAQCIFEFGPHETARSAALTRELGDGAHAVVTGRGVPSPAQTAEDYARMLKPEAIARAKTVKHADAFYGEGAHLAYAPWIGACDLVIVNASGDAAHTKCDSLTALHLVRPDGIVLWCDYGRVPAMTECLDELYGRVERLRSLRRLPGTSLCLWRSRS